MEPIKTWSAQQDAFEENTNINTDNFNLAQEQVNPAKTEFEQLININNHSEAQQQINPHTKHPQNLTDINSISFQLANSQPTSIIESDSHNFELPDPQIALSTADSEDFNHEYSEEISSSIGEGEQPELVINSPVVEPEFKQNLLEQMPELASVYALLDALDDDDDTLPNPDQNYEVVLNQSNSEPVPMQKAEDRSTKR